MKSLEIFKLIFDQTKPCLDNNNFLFLLIFAQIYFSAFLEIKFLFKSIKTYSKELKLFACMVPSIFILSFFIVSSLFFNSFINGGLYDRYLKDILNMVNTNYFLIEMFIVIIIFLFVCIVYKKIYKLNILNFSLLFGLEIIFIVFIIILYGGILINHFPLSINELSKNNYTILSYTLVMYFNIIFKIFITVTSIILGLIFNDRKSKKNINEQNNYIDYENEFINFITGKNKAISLAYTFFNLFVILILYFSNQNSSENEFIQMLSLTIIILTPSIILNILVIKQSFFPKTTKIYKTISSHPLSQDLFYKFYCEIIVSNKNIYENKFIESQNFIFYRESLLKINLIIKNNSY